MTSGPFIRRLNVDTPTAYFHNISARLIAVMYFEKREGKQNYRKIF